MGFPATVDVSNNPPDQTQSESLRLVNVDYHEHSLRRLSDATYCLRRLERRLALSSLVIAFLAFGLPLTVANEDAGIGIFRSGASSCPMGHCIWGVATICQNPQVKNLLGCNEPVTCEFWFQMQTLCIKLVCRWCLVSSNMRQAPKRLRRQIAQHRSCPCFHGASCGLVRHFSTKDNTVARDDHVSGGQERC